MLKTYRMKVRSVRTVTVELEADDAEVAMTKARAGMGIGQDFVRTEVYVEILEVIDGTRSNP